MNVPDDLKGMYAEALLYSEKPWYWLQIVPSKIISLIERIATLEAENKEYALTDSLLREAYENSGVASRFTWSGWLLQIVRENTTLRQQLERLSAPVTDAENFHFENDEVLAAVQNTQYAKSAIEHRLTGMTVDQKWSLYRAVVKLAMAARKVAA